MNENRSFQSSFLSLILTTTNKLYHLKRTKSKLILHSDDIQKIN